ncbi:uncharacterized protein LOC18439446 isoform X1 [Amborella trichopoda]|uniref:N-acetyltransferase domain-containing protein n=1 Tax=Amborella trichopoda TaxID=13333 RepID=W1PTV4_AMBTC|nr:uncharacterized protein LOC18439446 isoform X1 [Amborella trichopoda]ERN11254.1 hypothetical protein AMTR_s00024p00232860 [Amborella trichopoda]|eukprot:XP_006849673.1 uncharacterized protein LOC18439446 isoform X1 [Amborella trichopoda]
MAAITCHMVQCQQITRNPFHPGRSSATKTNAMFLRKINAQCKDISQQLHISMDPQLESRQPSDLHFEKLQPANENYGGKHIRVFGSYVAREAMVDEEYWTAAWLRAESHWESQLYVRYIDSYKRKFAEQEFSALKRRCTGQQTQKSYCIVGVKKEENNVKRMVLNSILGTLDMSIQHLLRGRNFPGGTTRTCISTCLHGGYNQERYGYVSNLCVAKFARRQGIASNMLYLAIDAAKASGVDQIFVHVDKDNKPAQKLYEKIGFQMVEEEFPNLSMERNYLLCFKM